MTEALKCPACAANLEYPEGGGASMRCPYCNTTVLLTGNTPRTNATAEFAAGTGPSSGQMADVLQRLRAGDKIGAIRIFRQLHNADLATAKAAVEKLAMQQQAGPNIAPDIAKAASSALGLGLLLTFGILFLTGMILFITFRSVHKQLSNVSQNWPKTPSMTSSLIPSGPPQMADMVMQFGSEGIGAGGFDDIRSIATDNQGHLFVAEYSSGRVQAFDDHGKFLSVWSVGHDKTVSNMTADRKGMIYAVVSGHINRYEGLTGKPSGEVENVLDDVQQHYSDVFATFDGSLYAIGTDSNIVEIDPENGQIKRIINTEEKVGEKVSLERVAVIGTGEIFALGGSKGIFKFGPDGHYINRFAGGKMNDRVPGHIGSPFNIAVDGKGRIYVTDTNAAVQVFDSEGTYLGTFGGNEIVFGLAITDANEIYGCCRNSHAVKKYVLKK